MLNISNIASNILTYLLNLGWTISNSSTTNPTTPTKYNDIYLGLYTTLPTVSSTGVVSGGTEVSGANYQRVKLTEFGLGGTKKLSAVDFVQRKISVYDGETAGEPETSYVARVRNHTEEIYFPYTGESGDGYGTVVGFGVFSAKTAGDLILFGKLKTSLTVPYNVVPVILKDKLEITLG